ncbi:MAG: hypothetical protein IPO81_09180 [Kouleothrix sp.]|nr:hypothetical protein [Kouleothrix sp.]
MNIRYYRIFFVTLMLVIALSSFITVSLAENSSNIDSVQADSPSNVSGFALNAILAAKKNITLVPGTVLLTREMSSPIRDALELAQDAPAGTEYFAVTDLRRIDDATIFASVVGLGGIDKNKRWNLLDNSTWFSLIILSRNGSGQWVGAIEGTQAFSRLLANLPENQLNANAKQLLDPIQRRLVQAATAGYRFPWQSGTSMLYGPEGVHDNGFAGVVSGWKAVDMLSDGNTSAGHAPNRLLAAASGTISYVCRAAGQDSVAIRIGDLMYTHLLDNSNLYVGRSFTQGDELGQLKTGSFNQTCGYANQLANWFHVHWGFPNTGSFQAEDWTLSLSDGLWHRGTETRGINSWLQAAGSTPPSCNPSADQIALFVDANYGGQCVVKGAGDYTNQALWGSQTT